MQERLLGLPAGSRGAILAPLVRGRKGEHRKVLENIESQGYVRVRVDGEILEVEKVPALHKQKKHDIDAVVDRLVVDAKNARRVADSLRPPRDSGGTVWWSPAAKSMFSRSSSRVRIAAPASASCRRACSPSTRRTVPA
jgi:excinuclease UvrABC ATPase subunit